MNTPSSEIHSVCRSSWSIPGRGLKCSLFDVLNAVQFTDQSDMSPHSQSYLGLKLFIFDSFL